MNYKNKRMIEIDEIYINLKKKNFKQWKYFNKYGEIKKFFIFFYNPIIQFFVLYNYKNKNF